jgi:uncharacterized HAD superfamily protein
MKVIVDVDGTICSQEKSGEYDLATPKQKIIDRINWLYDNDHRVIYWTARGGESGGNYHKLTKEQLQKWGCKYHELWMGKPSYDLWIDDKADNSWYWLQDQKDSSGRSL